MKGGLAKSKAVLVRTKRGRGEGATL